MQYPAFYDLAPSIAVTDPLAAFLGATEQGIIEYRYIDAVKLTGHSCPTVASVYLLTLLAIRKLYPDSIPERGNIRVEFNKRLDEGVTGVIANVAALLTGAASNEGFKGISGAFDRRDKLFFAVDIDANLRFTRLDNGRAVDASVDMSSVPASPRVMQLLSKCRAGNASSEESSEFKQLWQDRVRRLLLKHVDDKQVFSVVVADQQNQ
jgi:formylmethanofuran dehydrogenase subunit E